MIETITYLLLVLYIPLCLYGLTLVHGALNGAPFLPTPRKGVRKMLEFAGVRRGQKVYDLGCGDGRLVFEASRKGARAVGVEIAPLVYYYAQLRRLLAGHGGTLRRGNLMEQDVRDADAVFCYLTPMIMPRLADRLRAQLRPGTRIVSHRYELPGFRLARSYIPRKAGQVGSVYLYIR